MNHRSVGTRDYTSAGCLFAVPVVIALGFRGMLKYAQSKEHQFSHQVEEVELEGDAAALLDQDKTAKEALERFVQKLERTTEQFSKMGGRFSPSDFERQKRRLEAIQERFAQDIQGDPACKQLVQKAQQCLQQYQPQ